MVAYGRTTDKRAVGRAGEDLVARRLEDAGWCILDRNWRGQGGELDIVALEGEDLVVIEVKTRTGTGFGHPAEAVTPAKAARLRRLTGQWLAEHCPRAPLVRVDVVAVWLCPGEPARVEHLRGIL
ncbi:YraN family protein [Sanguibacter sp. A247]|uniref:YraN family protein n=1 Tax=unclassified Sanguibacter TaxID=2645534 RepID=UPI003FD8B1B5